MRKGTLVTKNHDLGGMLMYARFFFVNLIFDVMVFLNSSFFLSLD